MKFFRRTPSEITTSNPVSMSHAMTALRWVPGFGASNVIYPVLKSASAAEIVCRPTCRPADDPWLIGPSPKMTRSGVPHAATPKSAPCETTIRSHTIDIPPEGRPVERTTVAALLLDSSMEFPEPAQSWHFGDDPAFEHMTLSPSIPTPLFSPTADHWLRSL